MTRQATLAAVVLLCCSAPAGAQQSVHVQFKDGLVWLAAQDATVAEILREWSRVGGATVVNADAGGGVPITVEIQGASEREALAIVLRNVPGYLLGAREEPSSAGSSVLGRVFIVPMADSRNVIGASPAAAAGSRAAKTPEEDDATRTDEEDFPGVLGELVQLTGFAMPTTPPPDDPALNNQASPRK